MGAGWLSRGRAGLLGAGLLVPGLLMPVLMLAACQSAVAPVEAVVAAPALAPKPVRVVARAVRPKPGCLTTTRKQELFRQFAAMQDGDVAEAVPAVEAPRAVQPSCKQAEK